MSEPDPEIEFVLSPTGNRNGLDFQPQSDPPLSLLLRGLTAARVGLRRAGISIATCELLDFQLAHARARDAVHAALQPATLIGDLRSLLISTNGPSDVLLLHSAAKDRQTYLQRPDLGRKLDTAGQRRLRDYPRPDSGYDLSFVVADGLSALAVERHVIPLLAEVLPALSESASDLRMAPICVVEQGRVAVADEIAHTLSASLAIMLIGERPGLSSPDSLGAYITWRPEPGQTTDANRNCISNIRAEGLSYAQAATRLLHYIHQARSRQISGTALKDPDPVPGSMSAGELGAGFGALGESGEEI